MIPRAVTKAEAHKYVNIIAQAMKIISGFPVPYNQMQTICNNEKISNDVSACLNSAYPDDIISLDSFFDVAREKILQAKKLISKNTQDSLGEGYIIAKTVCTWMDLRITYEPYIEKKFSLYALLEKKSNEVSVVEAMNNNFKKTGIEIFPKFETCKITKIFQGQNKISEFGNRDIFDILNGELNNVIVFKYDKKLKVNNVILWLDIDEQERKQHFNVTFCPMTDKKMNDVFDLKDVSVIRSGIAFDAKKVNGVKIEDELLLRLENDWKNSCINHSDIVFFPEMLGLTELQKESKLFKVNKFFNKCCHEMTSQSLKAPLLTLFPSYWRDGVNSVTVIDRNGMVIGRQKKRFAFVHQSSEDSWQEALAEQDDFEILLIHVPGYHRIAIMICADFLALQNQHLQDIYCAQLCATLILVPSYSSGEQDFINTLNSLGGYGTTVVWGDCCGAVRPPRIIGGYSIADTDNIKRFGLAESADCSCSECNHCIFMCTLPTDMVQHKPNPPEGNDIIKHLRR